MNRRGFLALLAVPFLGRFLRRRHVRGQVQVAKAGYVFNWREQTTDHPGITQIPMGRHCRTYTYGCRYWGRIFALKTGPGGWIEEYLTDADGRIVRDETGTAPKTVKRTGLDVEFMWNCPVA